MTVRVLIADDHEPVRRGIRSLLARRQDWTVCGEAADGLEATHLARELRPDVILMDMSMPRMDGAEATRIIRKDVPSAEVIIVTQNDPAIVRQHAAQIGARGYVSKATLARDLLPAILKIIGGPQEEESPSASATQFSPGDWLCGGGDLGHLIREHDWSQTPLGPIDRWPQSLRTAVNLMLNSQHPIWIGWGPDITFLYNDAYISVLSLTKHPGSLGRPAREVWSEIWQGVGPLAEKVFSQGEACFSNDMRLFMDRGEYVEETFYSFSYSPIYDESAKVGGLFCPSAEVTAKVLHARRLRTLSELSAKALVERSSQAACASSVEIISQNPDDIPFSLLYLLDQDRQSARLQGAGHITKGIAFISPLEIDLSRDDSVSPLWPIREVLQTCQCQVVPLAGIDSLPLGPAGQYVTEALVLPVTAPGQAHPIGVFIAGVNPTRKLDADYRTFFALIADQVGTAIQNAGALEHEKKRAEALAEIDRAKTAFFSNVSHEFRTPLTLMLAPLEDALASGAALPPEQRQHLEVAHRNSLRLLKLVNTLLDFSRIEAGRFQASYESTDLSALTAELASVFRSAAERAGLRLLVDCPPLPQPVYVDREMWEKIVFNLLSNALKFTFSGEIEVSLRQHDGLASLSVRDTGTGIPRTELPHLFERFYRVKGARGRAFEGSGIGLALVQELTKLHGGSVRVDSELDRGSTFTVSLRLGKDHLPQDRIGAARTLESTGMHGQAYVEEALRWLPPTDILSEEFSIPLELPTSELPRRPDPSPASLVLLADDNADMRDYLQRLLRPHYHVLAVPDGVSALESARQLHPDLILSDVMMPRLDGFGLLQAVRADDSLKNVPVILLSARAGEESRIHGLQSGADDYLVKPFSARELLARVGSHLAMVQIRRESEDRLRRLSENLEAEVHARTKELEQRNADILRQSEHVRELSRRLLQVQDQERRHFARELHDSAGQTLTVLAMNIAKLVKEASPAATGLASETKELVQQLTQEIRTTSYLLHPPMLDENGLAPAIRWYIDGLRERSGIEIALDIPEPFERLPQEVELVIFRVVQEALTNIHRHSRSKSAEIKIARQSDCVAVEIQDHGQGMSPEKLAEVQSNAPGVGIRGMRERVRQLYGNMIIASDSSGTRILATIPLSHGSPDELSSSTSLQPTL